MINHNTFFYKYIMMDTLFIQFIIIITFYLCLNINDYLKMFILFKHNCKLFKSYILIFHIYL